MSEQQDLLVHPDKAALWELREREGETETVFCVVITTKSRLKLCVAAAALGFRQLPV